MRYTRREFGRLALSALPATTLLRNPNSVIDGVHIGTITYSYRSMPDQSAEATLRYILESGISEIELMNGPAESFAGAPQNGRGTAGRGPSTSLGARGRGQPPTPEQQAAQQEAAAKLKAWRTSVSMDPFKKLRKMYNDAGVSIYAFKQLSPNMSDEEFEYVFSVAEALGATHTTLELPAGPEAEKQLKRIGDFAMKKKVYAAYHTHAQGSMTAFDQAFAISKGNMANVDLGHWTAGGNKGGSPMDFLNKHHDRTSSFHIKDRTTPEHCALNLAWGTGETPLKEILQLVKKNKWKIPASVEMEYAVPEGSDPVKEVRKCVEYCRAALST